MLTTSICKANEEDNCKGRFWEGRFKSQPLLDEAAVMTAMAYVDLNPIRANIAKTPETSDFTSATQRFQALKQQKICNAVPLMKLVNSSHQQHKNSFAFSTTDYLELLDWAGRAIAPKKRGFIEGNKPPILERLNLNSCVFAPIVNT